MANQLVARKKEHFEKLARCLGGRLHRCPVNGWEMIVADPTKTQGSVVVPLTSSFWRQEAMPTTTADWEDAIVEMVEEGWISSAV